MGYGLRPATCERVRAQIALELDRDFSQLERARRVSHVAYCAECRAFESDIREFTRLLREAPAERPSRPFAVPRRSAAMRSLRAPAVAAAMVLALVGVATQVATDLATTSRGSTAAPNAPTVYPTGDELESEVQFIEVLGESPRLMAATSDLR